MALEQALPLARTATVSQLLRQHQAPEQPWTQIREMSGTFTAVRGIRIMKYFLAFVLCLFGLSAQAVTFQAITNSTTVFVDTNGFDSGFNIGIRGIPDRPFKTIQGGVTAAQAGDTIQVNPGTYYITESITNFPNNITVRGYGATIVNQIASAPAPSFGIAIWPPFLNGKFYGLTITNASTPGSLGNEFQFAFGVYKRASNPFLQTFGTTNLLIQDCTCYGDSDALFFSRVTNINYVTIRNCKSLANWDNIAILPRLFGETTLIPSQIDIYNSTLITSSPSPNFPLTGQQLTAIRNIVPGTVIRVFGGSITVTNGTGQTNFIVAADCEGGATNELHNVSLNVRTNGNRNTYVVGWGGNDAFTNASTIIDNTFVPLDLISNMANVTFLPQTYIYPGANITVTPTNSGSGYIVASSGGGAGNGPFTNDLHYYNPGSDPADAKLTLDVSARTLNDGAGFLVMDFSPDRELFDDNASLAITFRGNSRVLSDSSEITSVDWGQRNLKSSANAESINYADEANVVVNSGGTAVNISQIGDDKSVTASGTAATLTGSMALMDFGTQDPETAALVSGATYLIIGSGTLKYNATTYAANQTCTVQLFGTDDTAVVASQVLTLRIITTVTDGAGTFSLSGVHVATSGTDTIQIRAQLSATPGAGSVQCSDAKITCVRIR